MPRNIPLLASLATLALGGALACGARAPQAAEVSCSNGVRDGSESGVDCGGSCGPTCGLAQACGAPSDCLFGLCSGGACVAPTGGPAPTGPVTATVSPAAPTTLSVVTDEHVAVSLEFPAGAVAAPLEVTLTPLPPSAGSWLRVLVEPAGALLSAPATVRVELPSSTPPAAAQDAVLGWAGASDASVLPTSVAGTTLAAPSRALGLPGFVGDPSSVPVLRGAAGGPRAQALSLPSPASVLQAIPMNLATRIAVADGLVTALRATGRYRDAVEVASLIVLILQGWGDPAREAQLRAFVDRTWSSACAGFGDARAAVAANLSGGHPLCIAEASRFERPLLAWVSVLQRLEGYATGSCAGYSDGAWTDLREAHLAGVAASERADVARMWRCDCAETPREEWTPALLGRCPLLGSSAERSAALAPAAVAPSDLPSTDAEWDHLVDTVERAYLGADQIDYLGLDALADGQRASLADPHLQLARELAYGGCRRDGSAKPVAKLLSALPGHAGLRADGQYCATSLEAQHRDASGTVLAQLSPALGGVDPGQTRDAGTLQAGKTGTLRLGGSIAALHCPAGATGGSEALEVRLDGTTVDTLDVIPYLALPVDLDLAAALELAHPGATDALRKATLTLERVGAPCDGFWGDNPAPLLTLELPFEQDRIAFARVVGSVWQIFSVNPDGTGVTQLTSGTAAAQRPAWSPDRKKIAFSMSGDIHTMNADGSGLVALTSGSSDDGEPTWSPDGQRVAFRCSGAGPGDYALCAVNADGTGLVHLTSGTEDNQPAWSPDGTLIAFTSYGAGQTDIYVVSPAGGERTNLTNFNAAGYGDPAWSPGGRLAFRREGAIWAMNGDGTGLSALTPTGGNDISPAWSPDGARIAFSRSDGNVYVMKADGTNVSVVTAGVTPAW